ncbi:MAG: DUF4118 domain-containing protein [Acidobacteriota bacterium]|nr:DUF4118 domain-containing protein [Acidobacteriota bacterium]
MRYNPAVNRWLQNWYVRCLLSLVQIALVVALGRLLHANATTVGYGFLIVVLFISAGWGLRAAILASVAATLCYNYFFLPPVGTFTISDPHNWIALFSFLMTSVVASQLSERARRETLNATNRRRELERLYTLSQQMLTADNVLGLINAIPEKVAEIFGAASAALYTTHSRKAYYSDLGAQQRISFEELQQVSLRGEISAKDDMRIVPLRLGMRAVGALALGGVEVSSESIEAVSSLVAIAIERAAAVEQLAHSEAGRESERLRSVLLDSVTHNFRTPLTSIKASAQSLLGDAGALDAAARHELLTIIDEECDRLDRLVGEAARMAQIDAHAIELDLRPGDIHQAIEAALETNQNALARHRLCVNAPDTLPRAVMDVRHTAEILSQLLDNAAKYSPAGTVITVTAEVYNGMLMASVADQGPGIEAVDQSMVFDKFYRGRGQRQSVQGTGMGLSIAKAIVEAQGGSISLTTQPGHGSVFSFTLPLAR